jgi:threonine dehydratase
MYNALCALDKNPNIRSFCCVSYGNHAQGVAMTCAILGKQGVIFMPKNVIKEKLDRTIAMSYKDGKYYADVILEGETFCEAINACKEFSIKNNSHFIQPYDDERTIIGQSTIMLDIEDQIKNIDYCITPVGGGGLLAGIFLYRNIAQKNFHIVAVETDICPALINSLKNKINSTVDIKDGTRYADAGIVVKKGEQPWNIIKNQSNFTAASIDNQSLLYSLGMLKIECGIKVEGICAMTLAYLFDMSKKQDIKNKTIVLLMTGNSLPDSFIKDGEYYYKNYKPNDAVEVYTA